MAFCKSCGSDIGEAKFCPACGTAQDVSPVELFQETVAEPFNQEPVTTPVFAAAPTYTSTGNTEGMNAGQVPPIYSAPVYSTDTFEKPSSTGQTVFSIINIALGLILCCCSFGLSFVSMVLGIIALVFSMQSGKQLTLDEARKKLKTAKLLNIIGVVILGVSLIICIILMSLGTLTDMLDNYGYYY